MEQPSLICAEESNSQKEEEEDNEQEMEEQEDPEEEATMTTRLEGITANATEVDAFPPEEQDPEEEEEMEEEEEGEEEEDEEEDTFVAPIMDSRNITFKTRILNEYLLCSLCMGYYKDATTIKECLHTFCKSCIYKYFAERSDCPRCQVHLGTNPFELVKPDRQLQAIVDKIFPELEIQEAQRERDFYKERGIEFQEPIPPIGKVSSDSSLKRPAPPVTTEEANKESADTASTPQTKKLKKSEALKKFYLDEVAFQLTLDENENEDTLKSLDKPYIRTSAKVSILHLKKYLKKKLNANITDVEITYKGELLGNEHTLEYIFKTRGVLKETKTPSFKYKLRKEEHPMLQ